MKTKQFVSPILAAIFFMGCSWATAQSGCSAFYPLVKGTKMSYANYNKKGKEDGEFSYLVSEVTPTGNGVSAIMQISYADKKKQAYDTSYGITCTGDMVSIDFKSLLNSEMFQQYKDMKIDITGTDIQIPNSLSVGQTLPDANVTMKMSMGVVNMNMETQSTNRKVEKKETVTTPAGTFDCYVIYSESRSKIMGAEHTFPSRLWLAEGVGMVKQETYKGTESMGSTVLTSLSR